MNIQLRKGCFRMGEIIVFIANSWGIINGGINAFNYDLARNLAKTYSQKGKKRTVCIVLDSSANSIIQKNEKRDYGLELYTVGLNDDEKYQYDDRLPVEMLRLDKLIDIGDEDRVIWVGHDVKTGNYANLCRDKYFGKSVVICHMDYDSYYFLSTGDAEGTNKKRHLQIKIFENADVLAGVGPRLVKHVEDIINKEIPVFEIDPGMLDAEPRKRRLNTFRAIFTGRIEKKNNYIKQPTLAIAAFVRAIIEYPEAFAIEETEPTLDIIGYDEVTNGKVEELTRVVKTYSKERTVNVRANKYIKTRPELIREIVNSSLSIMISRHEGFGLAAYEAIAAGVPVIISKQSGLYQFLKRLPEISENIDYLAVDIGGELDEDDLPLDSDINKVKELIAKVAMDVETYRNKAMDLRTKLKAQGYTWDGQAQAFYSNLYYYCYHQEHTDNMDETNQLAFWENDKKTTSTEFWGEIFLPNMCEYILGLKPTEYFRDYVKCVLVRFDEELQIRCTIAEAGLAEVESKKPRPINEGVVGIMQQVNHAENEKSIMDDRNCFPIFYDFRNRTCYFVNKINEITTRTKYNDSAGEQDYNLRAILAIPIVHENRIVGATTIDFFNLSKMPEEKDRAEIKQLLLKAQKQMHFMNTCIFSRIE